MKIRLTERQQLEASIFGVYVAALLLGLHVNGPDGWLSAIGTLASMAALVFFGSIVMTRIARLYERLERAERELKK